MIRRRPLLAVSLAVLAAACGPAAGSRPAPVRESSAPSTALGQDPDGASIYQLDLPLIDDAGRALRLADLRGRTIVAAMMYTTCTSVCPRVTADMQVIERKLSEHDRRDVTFALFSLDPGKDTAAQMQRFAREHRLGTPPWRLFAASEDGVRDLAAVFGVKYARQADGEIAHSAMIFVIDRDGAVRHRQVGLGARPEELLEALARARP